MYSIQKILENKFLNRLSSIEFVVSEKCQNSCKYCYRVKKHAASSVQYINPENIHIYMENWKEMFNEEPSKDGIRIAELFGGDATVSYSKFKKVTEILINDYKFRYVTIPTNARLLNELHSYDIDNLFENIPAKSVIFSLSVDGNPADSQRPLSKYGKMLAYEEKINYDKIIEISKKYGYGFHPMLSFENTEIWEDAINFFFDRDVFPYLLEIRHPLYSNKQILDCVYHLAKIRIFFENKIKDKETRERLVRKLNTVSLSKTPRGLGCSAHTTATIMPNGDLPFCHRVVDKPWVMANLLTKEMDISKIVTLVSGHHHKNHPNCINCCIREVCSGQCAGASYEYWGDPWIPINSICKYLKLKNWVFFKLFDDWNIKNQNELDYKQLDKEIKNIFSNQELKNIMDTLNKVR